MCNTYNNKNQYQTEYYLDIRNLCKLLFKKKYFIILFSVFSALIAFGSSYFIDPKWVSTAITCAPKIDNLGSYYFNKRFLRNLDFFLTNTTKDEELQIITKEVYHEFIKQLGSYDTRREFWMNSDYYKNYLLNNPKKASIFLDDLINNIEFVQADESKNISDNIKLTAKTSRDSNQLLRKYIEFANKRAMNNLNNEIKSIWKAETQYIKFLIKREDTVAKTIYKRQLNLLKQSLKIAKKKGILYNYNNISPDDFSNYNMFMFGSSLLKSQIESLSNIGPDYDDDYENKAVILSALNDDSIIKNDFKTYRYLKTPEDPLEISTPRRVFIFFLWGTIGLLVGTAVVICRRVSL